MKLQVNRKQVESTGIFGGAKGYSFEVSMKLEVSSDEAALIDKYKVMDWAILWKEEQGTEVPELTVRGIIGGFSFLHSAVSEVIKKEGAVKDACEELRDTLIVMESFGGSEIIEL